MGDIAKSSFLLRAICGAYEGLRKFYSSSLIGRAGLRMHESFELSGTAAVWQRRFGADDPAAHSVYAAFLRLAERFLHAAGAVLSQSLFYRGLCALRDSYFRLSSGSRLLSAVNRVPLHRWLLVLFALYLPAEYALRDVLKLSLLASVWEELFILLGAVMVIWRACLKQSDTFSEGPALEVALLLYMAAVTLLMLLNRPYPAIAMAGLRAQVEYIVWFFILLRLIEDEADAKTLIFGFLAVAGLLALHGIYQYVAAVPIPSSWVSQTEMGVRTRVFSVTGSPNIFGSLLLMAAPAAASLAYYFRSGRMKLLGLCLTGAVCLSILFTFSRGSWVGLIVAVIIFSLFMDKRLIWLMCAAAAALLAAVPSIASRLTYLFTSDYAEASAIGGRTLRWEMGRNLIRENSPWLGFGLGRFGGAVAMNNQVMDKTEEFEYFYMDNYYLKTLVETGYTGIIFYMLALIAFVFMALRAIKSCEDGRAYGVFDDALHRNSGSDKCLAAGLFAGLSGVLVHCYFENIFEEPYMMAYFWGLAAALFRLGRLRRAALKGACK